jgi:sugar O-acyltransferase (sialic acid O-acetyltransferase NeuD family)
MEIIIGAAGFAKEVEWLIHDSNVFDTSEKHHINYFVGKNEVGEIINGIEVISDATFHQLLGSNQVQNVFIAVGSPALRKKLYQSIEKYSSIHFPNLFDARAIYDKRSDAIRYGKGLVVCAGNVLTTNIEFGDFVHVNLNCTIGHDVVIGDFCTLSPSVSISGNVHLGNEVFIGTGAIVLEHLHICDQAVIGAGAVVAKDITEPGTYVGVPAKRIK